MVCSQAGVCNRPRCRCCCSQTCQWTSAESRLLGMAAVAAPPQAPSGVCSSQSTAPLSPSLQTPCNEGKTLATCRGHSTNTTVHSVVGLMGGLLLNPKFPHWSLPPSAYAHIATEFVTTKSVAYFCKCYMSLWLQGVNLARAFRHSLSLPRAEITIGILQHSLGSSCGICSLCTCDCIYMSHCMTREGGCED